MESSLTGLTFLFQEKLRLYHELVEILKSESRAIISSQVDQLWETARRKNQIVSDVEVLRGRILQHLTNAGISHDMTAAQFNVSRVMGLVPLEIRKTLLHFQSFFLLIKEEIRSRTRENMAYAEKYLSTIDELMSLFMGAGNDSHLYDRSRMADKYKTYSRLHREV